MSGTDPAAAVVAEEWCAALGLPAPGDGGDFFAEGGNSLMAVALIERVERRLGIDFPIDVMFLDGTYPAVLLACLERVAEPGRAGR